MSQCENAFENVYVICWGGRSSRSSIYLHQVVSVVTSVKPGWCGSACGQPC